jgi:hypothetical protein
MILLCPFATHDREPGLAAQHGPNEGCLVARVDDQMSTFPEQSFADGLRQSTAATGYVRDLTAQLQGGPFVGMTG